MAKEPVKEKSQSQRDDLTGEHAIGDAGQIALALLFAVIWIMDTFFWEYTTSLNQYLPPVIQITTGIILLIISGYLARTGLAIVFGEQREEPGVIRKSVFNIVRHPIYLSEIILYLACLMFSLSLAAAVVWIISIGFLYGISRYEERLLLERFGEEYKQYMREVPMLIPRLWKR